LPGLTPALNAGTWDQALCLDLPSMVDTQDGSYPSKNTSEKGSKLQEELTSSQSANWKTQQLFLHH
jgi:hypothetical protein